MKQRRNVGRKAGAYLAALAFLGFFFVLVVRDGPETSVDSGPPSEDQPTDSEISAHPGSPAGARELQRANAPSSERMQSTDGPRSRLPDFALPLALQLPTLIALSKNGDARAACRLVASINRCTTAVHRREFADRVLKSLESGKTNNESLMIDLLARSEVPADGTSDYCDGVEISLLPTAEEALGNALNALNVQQKTVIAMLRSDGQLRRLVQTRSMSEPSTYVVPDIISRNQHAFLLAGFHAKDPLALEGLIMMHSPSSAIMSQGVWGFQPNVRLFLKYALTMARLYGSASLGEQGNRAVAAASSALSDEELGALGREAEAEALSWAAASGVDALPPGEFLPRVQAPGDPVQLCGN